MNQTTKLLPRCTAHDTVGAVLAKTKTSHEPVLVFDNHTFLGLLSPYKTLFFHRYPYQTHVEHCLIKPLHITENTSLFDIAAYMRETRLYSLPIFNHNNEINGTITIDTIFKYILNQPELLSKINNIISYHLPITSSFHATVKDVYVLMREKKVGRIILVDNNNHLRGIVSRRDLQDAFTAKTVHQRYTTRKRPPVHSSFDEEPIDRRDSPVMEFATQRVQTASNAIPKAQVIHQILTKKIHSIVIVKDKTPIGFLSRYDILETFCLFTPHTEIPIIWTKHFNNLDRHGLQKISTILDTLFKKIDKQFPIRRAEVHIDQHKNAAGDQKKLVTAKLRIILDSGAVLTSHAQDWDLTTCMHELTKKIMHEIEMSDRQKHLGIYGKQRRA